MNENDKMTVRLTSENSASPGSKVAGKLNHKVKTRLEGVTGVGGGGKEVGKGDVNEKFWESSSMSQ